MRAGTGIETGSGMEIIAGIEADTEKGIETEIATGRGM